MVSEELEKYAASCLSGKALEAFLASTGAEHEELLNKALSAWMTSPELAERMVKWANVRGFVLEPSCGTGNIANAARAAGCDVTTIDVDPRRNPDICRNYLDVQFSAPFDWVAMNSPFENDMDMLFLEKAAMDAEDVVALVRLNALAGQKRHARIWKHVSIAGLVILANRPSFNLGELESGPPRHDFCLVHYTLRENVVQRPVEWWA